MVEIDAGIDAVSGHLVGEYVNIMAIGTGTTAATSSDTQLESEVFRATTGDAPLNWVDDPDVPGRFEAKLSVTGGDEVPAGTQITEAALFIGSESQIYSRDTFGVKEPEAGESVTSTMPIYGPI